MPTLASSLLQSAADVPSRIAIHLQQAGKDDIAMSYAQLIERGTAYASALMAQGVKKGDIVVIILPHGEALVYAWVGAVLMGAVPSILPPLTEKLAPDRYRRDLAALTEITKPAAIVTYETFASEVNLALAQSPTKIAVVIAELVAHLEFKIENVNFEANLPSEIALLQHSSGSTGLQKGVALAHTAIFNQLRSYAAAIQLSEADVIVSWLPLYHDMGLIAAFITPLMLRVPLVLMSPFDWVRAPQRLFHAITHYGGTLCWLPNFAYNFCAQKIRERDLQGVNLATMRAFVNCSEPTVYSSHQKFAARFGAYGLRDGTLTTCYAMAENVFAVSQSVVGEAPALDESPPDGREARLSNGKPIANVSVKIVDPDGATLPEHTIGEIALQSDCMLTGYFHRPDLTEKAMHGGWYLTGDMGYLKNGEVYITGRKKDIIIVGGKNVYPQDLELLSSEVAGVHPGRVVAFGLMDERAGTEEIVVVAESDIQDEDEQQTVADSVRAHLTRNTDVAVRVVQLVPLGWLVKTSSGKVARTANKEKYLQSDMAA
ncbi:MAG: AMP-binding protein [Anaerolineae bacterium]|nr:AMP-binding protein [Anaerolineae bacterium]